jgi:two-component system, NarL family, sensor histidine kinase UhpB
VAPRERSALELTTAIVSMRLSRLPLLWRVFAVNAGLLLAVSLVLAIFAGPIHTSIAVVETFDIAIGLVVMLAANLFLLRRALAPVARLVERMRNVDLLQPGQRLAEDGGPEIGEVVRSFNQMLDRLEVERRDSSSRALAAQEAERLRVARHLHDEVGQVLTGVLLQLDSLAAADDAKAAVRVSLEEVRRIAQELRPALLEHFGLVSALTELSRTFAAQTGIHVDRRFAAALPRLSSDAELAVYRVTQESLTNAARHAQAGRVQVLLDAGPQSVVLRVIDDGRGFADGQPDGGGIRGMRERAVLIGGALAVKPGAEGGVEVRFEAPAIP